MLPDAACCWTGHLAMGAHPGALCQGPESTHGACFKTKASAHSTCDHGSQTSSITWASGSLLQTFPPHSPGTGRECRAHVPAPGRRGNPPLLKPHDPVIPLLRQVWAWAPPTLDPDLITWLVFSNEAAPRLSQYSA